jgi:hypothetical protein
VLSVIAECGKIPLEASNHALNDSLLNNDHTDKDSSIDKVEPNQHGFCRISHRGKRVFSLFSVVGSEQGSHFDTKDMYWCYCRRKAISLSCGKFEEIVWLSVFPRGSINTSDFIVVNSAIIANIFVVLNYIVV